MFSSQLGEANVSGSYNAELPDELEVHRLQRIMQLEKLLFAYENLYDLPKRVQSEASKGLLAENGFQLWNFENDFLPGNTTLEKMWANRQQMGDFPDGGLNTQPLPAPELMSISNHELALSSDVYGNHQDNPVHTNMNNGSYAEGENYIDHGNGASSGHYMASDCYADDFQCAPVPSQQPPVQQCFDQTSMCSPYMTSGGQNPTIPHIPLASYQPPTTFYSTYTDPPMSAPPQPLQGMMFQSVTPQQIPHSGSAMAPFIIVPMDWYQSMVRMQSSVIPVPVPVIAPITLTWAPQNPCLQPIMNVLPMGNSIVSNQPTSQQSRSVSHFQPQRSSVGGTHENISNQRTPLSSMTTPMKAVSPVSSVPISTSPMSAPPSGRPKTPPSPSSQDQISPKWFRTQSLTSEPVAIRQLSSYSTVNSASMEHMKAISTVFEFPSVEEVSRVLPTAAALPTMNHDELADDVFLDTEEKNRKQSSPNTGAESIVHNSRECILKADTCSDADTANQSEKHVGERSHAQTAKPLILSHSGNVSATHPDSSGDSESGKTSPTDSAYSDEFAGGASSLADTPEPHMPTLAADGVSEPIKSTSDADKMSYAAAVTSQQEATLFASKKTYQNAEVPKNTKSSALPAAESSDKPKTDLQHAETMQEVSTMEASYMEAPNMKTSHMNVLKTKAITMGALDSVAPKAVALEIEAVSHGGPSTTECPIVDASEGSKVECLWTEPKQDAAKKKRISKRERRLRLEEAARLMSDDEALNQAIEENRRVYAASEEKRRLASKSVVDLLTPVNVTTYCESKGVVVRTPVSAPTVTAEFENIIQDSIKKRSQTIEECGYPTHHPDSDTREYLEMLTVFKSYFKPTSSIEDLTRGFITARMSGLQQVALPQAKTRIVIYKHLLESLPKSLIPEIMFLSFLLAYQNSQFSLYEKLFFDQF